MTVVLGPACAGTVGGSNEQICCDGGFKSIKRRRRERANHRQSNTDAEVSNRGRVLADACMCTLSTCHHVNIDTINPGTSIDTQFRHRSVQCSYVVQRRSRVSGRGGTAVLARCSDRGLVVSVHRVPTAVRVQGVGAGQRTAPVTRQTRKVGR